MPAEFLSRLSKPALHGFYSVAGAIAYEDDITAGRMFIETWRTVKKDERNILRDLINEHLLAGKQKEMSAHGIRRSFRYWSAEEKAEILTFARDVIVSLQEKMGIEAALGYGTALAVARSNDLIPHDDDVDLICSVPVEKYPTFGDGLDAVASAFEGQEFRIFGRQNGHCKFGRGKLMLDVFVAIQEGEFISAIPGPRKVILRSDVFPAQEIELFGVKVPAPRNFEAYLSKVYGDSWRTPDPIFGHNWNLGPFDGLIRSE